MKHALIAFFAILLTACVPQRVGPKIDLTSVDAIKSSIDTSFDKYDKTTQIVGPDGNVAPGKNYRNTALLRATAKEGRLLFIQIYVLDVYGKGWRFYHSAYDIDGNKLDFRSIDRDVLGCRGGCSYAETVGITIDIKYLEEHIDRGIQFKIVSNGPDQEYELPAAYVEAFYLKLQESGLQGF